MNYEQKKIEIGKEIDDLQNEYFSLITGLQKDGTPIDDYHETKFIYKWERMKELQRQIITRENIHKEICIRVARDKLEESFTPGIRKMLDDKVVEEIDKETDG
jgi:hypothetical protein